LDICSHHHTHTTHAAHTTPHCLPAHGSPAHFAAFTHHTPPVSRFTTRTHTDFPHTHLPHPHTTLAARTHTHCAPPGSPVHTHTPFTTTATPHYARFTAACCLFALLLRLAFTRFCYALLLYLLRVAHYLHAVRFTPTHTTLSHFTHVARLHTHTPHTGSRWFTRRVPRFVTHTHSSTGLPHAHTVYWFTFGLFWVGLRLRYTFTFLYVHRLGCLHARLRLHVWFTHYTHHGCGWLVHYGYGWFTFVCYVHVWFGLVARGWFYHGLVYTLGWFTRLRLRLRFTHTFGSRYFTTVCVTVGWLVWFARFTPHARLHTHTRCYTHVYVLGCTYTFTHFYTHTTVTLRLVGLLVWFTHTHTHTGLHVCYVTILLVYTRTLHTFTGSHTSHTFTPRSLTHTHTFYTCGSHTRLHFTRFWLFCTVWLRLVTRYTRLDVLCTLRLRSRFGSHTVWTHTHIYSSGLPALVYTHLHTRVPHTGYLHTLYAHALPRTARAFARTGHTHATTRTHTAALHAHAHTTLRLRTLPLRFLPRDIPLPHGWCTAALVYFRAVYAFYAAARFTHGSHTRAVCAHAPGSQFPHTRFTALRYGLRLPHTRIFTTHCFTPHAHHAPHHAPLRTRTHRFTARTRAAGFHALPHRAQVCAHARTRAFFRSFHGSLHTRITRVLLPPHTPLLHTPHTRFTVHTLPATTHTTPGLVPPRLHHAAHHTLWFVWFTRLVRLLWFSLVHVAHRMPLRTHALHCTRRVCCLVCTPFWFACHCCRAFAALLPRWFTPGSRSFTSRATFYIRTAVWLLAELPQRLTRTAHTFALPAACPTRYWLSLRAA